MKVLHVGKYYPPFKGGMERFLGDLLLAQHRSGLQAMALVHAAPKGRDAESQGVEVGGPPVRRVPCHGQLLYAPFAPTFPMVLNQVLENFRPDLLHFHVPNTSAFWALLSKQAKTVPWVVHWHADVVSSELDWRLAWGYKLYRPFEQLFLRHASRIIATSADYLSTSEPLKPWQEKATVVPLGIDPSRMEGVSDSARRCAEGLWGNSGCRILSVGRLTYYKGHEHLIRAATMVPDARVLIVGAGDLKRRLEDLIVSLGVSGRVELVGELPDDVLWGLMASCDLFCLPSIERTEAFGVVNLEAMYFSKPIVATAIPGSGVGWLVTSGGSGILVPPEDESTLAAVIDGLANDPARRRTLGRAGFENFNAEFHIDRIADRITKIYERLVA